ncbi:MAG: DNA/RNA non-specific endonuclease [Paludibacteraceae bacterium]|nr:DNA/RNA non-specific endonuclease [Paludibacteraceae bacterium]
MKKVVTLILALLIFLLLCAELMIQQTKISRDNVSDIVNSLFEDQPTQQPITTEPTQQLPIAPQPTATTLLPDNLEIPQLTGNQSEQYIEHLAYTVSFNPDYNIPNWVAYCLEKTEVQGEYSRTDKFLPDPLVKGDPVVSKDYSGSGYDRGHMAPAADMRWSQQAMKESFYMTNICPQNHNNNAGDWKDLEELVRDLAYKYDKIYIAAGPVVVEDTNTTIGTVRKIVVPTAFFKMLLRQKNDGSWTAIGFVMPNKPGNQPLMTYMLSVDEVETITDIDFFFQLPDSIQQTVEADFNPADWTI